MENLEVLVPSNDWECMVSAIKFGADAVYIGGSMFGMRANASNFDENLLTKAVKYAHERNVKVYVTCNTVPTNEEVKELPEFLKSLDRAGVDAIIVADIGVIMEAKKHIPNMELHASTQVGIVNYKTANALYDLGIKRVVLARELSLEDIKTIRQNTPKDLELEVFVHGAICMSFSGRCLISQYINGRDANRGECAQPCRWGYHLVEEKRPGEHYPIFEDEKGSYILNAKDICLIEHIDKLTQAGVKSLKIEGRAKSSYYVSVVANAYHMAKKALIENPTNYKTPDWILDEVTKISHRHYNTGFLFGKPEDGQYYEDGGYIRNYDVVAVVECNEDNKLYCMQRNKFCVGDEIEILQPGKKPETFKLESMLDEKNNEIESAPHAMMKVIIPYNKKVLQGSILRKQVK